LERTAAGLAQLAEQPLQLAKGAGQLAKQLARPGLPGGHAVTAWPAQGKGHLLTGQQ
jgi:hypothetical protein